MGDHSCDTPSWYLTKPPIPTQPGHPSVDWQNEYKLQKNSDRNLKKKKIFHHTLLQWLYTYASMRISLIHCKLTITIIMLLILMLLLPINPRAKSIRFDSLKELIQFPKNRTVWLDHNLLVCMQSLSTLTDEIGWIDFLARIESKLFLASQNALMTTIWCIAWFTVSCV